MRISNSVTANLQNRYSFSQSGSKVFNTNIMESITKAKYDTLTISEQGSLKAKLRNLDRAEVSHTNDAHFLNVVTNIVSSTLSYLKSKIEDTLDYYSSYKNKIENGELDKQVSFDEYAESMEKSKWSIDMGQTDIAKENAAVPVSADEIDSLKKQAYDQLQDQIEKLISKAAKSLNELFKYTKTDSEELTDKIGEIKEITTKFFRELPEFDIDKNESDFMAAIQITFENIGKTITEVTKQSEYK